MKNPFLGTKIVALRLALSLILPIVLGVLRQIIFSKLSDFSLIWKIFKYKILRFRTPIVIESG